MPARNIEFTGYGATHRGMKRLTNEDRFLVDNENGIYAVADGIGGLPLGEKASECAIRVLRRIIADETEDAPTTASKIIESIHTAVRHISNLASPHIGMGTTCTFLRTIDGFCEVGHVGDSAAFLITEQEIVRITQDHVSDAPTVGVQIRDSGGTTRRSHFYGRKILSRFIGQPDPLEPGVFFLQPKIGDRILICSDGICGPITEDEIYHISRAQSEPNALTHALIQTANNRGGYDNATAIVITCNTVLND